MGEDLFYGNALVDSYFTVKSPDSGLMLVSCPQRIRKYGLPSEAQWEYACRAGTNTPFYFGGVIATEIVNYNGNYTYKSEEKGIYRSKTNFAGSFPANCFGLQDMHGNVWEWCEDKWHKHYQGAPVNGSAWISGNNDDRLLRGGSWYDYPSYCRSACRYKMSAVSRSQDIGFRVISL
jgi:formylglycine-generating enzyme required for sulfatase activity